MFNLERAIANWRRSLVNAGLGPEVIDELECHLRDEIEEQMRATSDPRLAFDNAVRLMGDPVQLSEQFTEDSIAGQKVRGSHIPITLAKFAVVLVVPFAIMLLLSFFRVFDLRGNLIGILIGWVVFTAVALSTLTIILRAAKTRARCSAALANHPFPICRLQSPNLLEQARVEALALGHDFIGTEHLLLALLKDSDSKNKPRPFNLDYESVRSEVIRLISPNSPHPAATPLPLTPRANEALRIALKESNRLKHPLVTADHIFSGLVREGSGVAAVVLKKLRSR